MGNFNGWFSHLTYPQWERLRERQQAFSQICAWGTATFNLAVSGEDRFAENGLWVSGEFFEVFGVRPALGRLFNSSDDPKGCGTPATVLSHAFWQREFGGDPSIIGKTITVDGHPFEVIGVTPSGFFGVVVGRKFDLALPLCAERILSGERSRLDRRSSWWLASIGRLKPGSTLESATAQLGSVSPGLFEETVHSGWNAEAKEKYLNYKLKAVSASTGVSMLRREYGAPLWMLLALAGAVLLIASANLANLLLARARIREREMGVRQALGASRPRLVRQLLVESMLLAAIGAVCGAWFAPVAGGYVVSLISSELNPFFVDLATDWRVLGFTAGLAILTCVLFGLAPALRATRISPFEAMKSASRGLGSGGDRFGFRRVLVVSQVALSFVLLVGALLFSRSLFNLMTVDAGFQQDGILEADVNASRLKLTAERQRALHGELLARLRSVPGVESVASVSTVPMVGNWREIIYADNDDGTRKKGSSFARVSSGYFETLRIPMLEGRDFDDRDGPAPEDAAIVNEAFAREFFDGESPVGRSFKTEGSRGVPENSFRIIALVKDTKYSDLREDFGPIVFLAATQDRRPILFSQFLLRTPRPMPEVMASVKTAVSDVQPGIQFHFHDFKEQIRDTLMRDQLMAALSGFFGLTAAILATFGLYGLISYTVVQRRAEFGIRLALGASPRNIIAMTVREATVLMVIGLTIGVLLAIIVAKAVGSMLFGLSAIDPATFAFGVVSLSAAALTAAYLPARRAAELDPMAALRED
jgi:predicted permease